MKFEKKFIGSLEANSIVSMMGILDQNSGGYVAIEKVSGVLDGKKGTFFLQHSSFIDHGKESQSIQVIPNSGSEELERILGNMLIEIINGVHCFTFNYSID